MIPYGRQDINQDDIDAVVEVLKSDFLTQGPKVPEFESKVAEYCGVKYGVAVNSATSALHIACMALDIGSGDIVWTSPISFVASANCVLYCGGTIDFVDIDPDTFNISVDRLEEKLTQAEIDGQLPKAIIPVHIAGQSCDMKPIKALSDKYGFKIIEDASHAIGGSYHGHKVGSCNYSDMTVFSFHPVKIITAVEGGMVMTNNEEYLDKLRLYRAHGITSDSKFMTKEPDGPWYYEQITLGYNYRMSDIQAALGISQLERIDQFVSNRRDIAANYNHQLEVTSLKLPTIIEETESSWHLYIVSLTGKDISRHKTIFTQLRQKGIGVQLHYIPIFSQPYYKNSYKDNNDLMSSQSYYKSSLSLPIHMNLNIVEQNLVIENLSDLLSN